MTDKPRPLAIVLPSAERGRGPEDLRRLDRVNMRLARPNLTPKQRQDAIDERTAIEATPREVREKLWREEAAAETMALAALRGEDVQRQPSGAIRASNRDAIQSITRRLTDEQDSAARTLRDCYEARSEGLGSQMGGLGDPGGAAFDSDAAALAGVQRAKKLLRIGNVERGVLVGSYRTDGGTLRLIAAWRTPRPGAPPPHVALNVLRSVCAYNIALSALGDGRTFDRHLLALKLALDVAHEVICG